jgi:FAD synthase
MAIKYLGHPLTLTGRVVYGNQLGKTAEVPTINIK